MTCVGGIGYGNLGQKLLDAAAKEMDVAACADLKFGDDRFSEMFESKYAGAAAYETHEEMIEEEELDAVIVATPHTLHHEQVTDAIREDLDVFVEKPMVTDMAHAQDLYRTDEATDVVLSVGYPRHQHPAYTKIRDLVRDDTIGRITSVEGTLRQPGWFANAKNGWRTDREFSGGGQLYDTGQHLLDSVLYATDTTPQGVTVNSLREEDGVDVDSDITVYLQQEGQSAFPADIEIRGSPENGDPSHAYAPNEIDESLVINGEHGAITYADDRLTVNAGDGPAVFDYDDVVFDNLIQEEVDQFAAAVNGEDADIATAADGLYPVAIVEGVYAADHSGTTENISEYVAPVQGQPSYAAD